MASRNERTYSLSAGGGVTNQELIDALADYTLATEFQALQTTVSAKADQSALAAKADQSALDTLSSTVSGKADQTAVDAKADQTALDALATTVSGKADTSAVNAKADQTALDALSSTVSGKADNTLATGSLNGLMSAALYNKLFGIEADATADQTAAEIKALIDADEGNTDWRTQKSAATIVTDINAQLGGEDWQSGSGSGGEANTGSNVGGGAEVFKAKTGVDFAHRTLVAGTNVTVTQGADTITIDASGGGGGSSEGFQRTKLGEFDIATDEDLIEFTLTTPQNYSHVLVVMENIWTTDGSGMSSNIGDGTTWVAAASWKRRQRLGDVNTNGETVNYYGPNTMSPEGPGSLSTSNFIVRHEIRIFGLGQTANRPTMDFRTVGVRGYANGFEANGIASVSDISTAWDSLQFSMAAGKYFLGGKGGKITVYGVNVV